jgi:MerR family transcriptional regulator, redox-sensitive transcriptional activator SoxR
MGDESTLTIGEIASRAGIRTSAIRYYERVGVLPAPERVSGQRRYHEETVGRLGLIDAAQQAGFSLDEIAELLRSSDEGRGSEQLRELAAHRLPDVEALIERAQAMKRWLELATSCGCSTLEACALFEGGAPAGTAQLEPLKRRPAADRA